ncbi:cupredoxin domain-containing protein [Methylocaldum szegediense]|jgi:cytochrome c oxidase subunit 2|uniref:Cytochrome c oxidase subunit II n=1 Tax=Methylocaldum szegediense TaxID=73780 RepID=A0ABN8X568_9GAMM|nr:cytochrome c oxidase subunit II [Methylocaldum szegediense]CAI8885584.1 Cytochrome c oxidase subunit II [Methylocaldum szegediense]
MHVHPLEKKWIYLVLAVIGLFLAAIFYTALVRNIHPPSHIETIDSARLHLSEEFAEDKLGVWTQPDGTIRVTLVAARYGFYPREILLPAETPVTFRIASADVLHGVHIPMTNMGTMVVPGYVSEITTSFPKPGEYPMLCNEYCGLGHDHMWSKVTVVAKENWPAAPDTQSIGR